MAIPGARAQLLVDDFNRPSSDVVGNGWTEFETAGPSSVRVQSPRLRMSSSVAGRDRISRVTPGTYKTTLDSNVFLMEWAFSMRISECCQTGFNSGGNGLAVVLAGSTPDLMSGVGYAVVLGEPGSGPQRLRLVRYTGGLSSNAALTDIISTGDFQRNYLGVRVTYRPTTGEWELFYVDNGLSGIFPHPLSASTPGGSAVDRTHTTMALPYIGMFFNHSSHATKVAIFDDFYVPEDASTSVFFTTPGANIPSDIGSHTFHVGLNNPDPHVPVHVDVVLVSGDPADIGGVVTRTVKFEPGSGDPRPVTFDIRENGGCDGDRTLVFELQGMEGGIGDPHVGFQGTYAMVVEDQAAFTTVMVESFEDDGDGSRYSINVPHGTAGGGYFLRAMASDFPALGSPAPSNLDGDHVIGGMDMGGLAPDAEVTVMFRDIDILGLSGIDVGMLAGARNAPNYDNPWSDRDYVFVEVRVDDGAWVTVGAFRSRTSASSFLAQDTDLNGFGNGHNLSPALRNFNMPVALTGERMDLRIRFRTTDVNEEIYFDRVRVRGTLCQPVYFSNGSGSLADPIWSQFRDGSTSVPAFDRNASLVVQSGHSIVNTGDLQLMGIVVEDGAELALGDGDVVVHGESVKADGPLSSGQGSLVLTGAGAKRIEGGGLLDLYDLTVDAPGGVTALARTDIRGTLWIDDGVFTAVERVRLRSTASGTGRLAPLYNDADYAGNLVQERFIPGGATNWRLMGSAVADATVADWNEDFFTAGFPGSDYPSFQSPPGSGIPWASIRWYDETVPGASVDAGLTGVTGVGDPLVPGRGFAVWSGDAMGGTSAFTVDVTGRPNIGRVPIPLPMTWTNTGNPAADGWNLVSNPLPSPIAFTSMARGSDVLNTYSIFDPVTGNNAVWSNGVGTGGANGVIQSSQAFWLKATGPSVTTTVSEWAKTASGTGGLFGGLQRQDMPMLRLGLTSGINTFSDEVLIVFGQGTPVRDDQEGDAVKLFFGHPQAPRIAALANDGIPLAIDMHGPIGEDLSIPLVLQVGVSGTYTMAVNELVTPGVLSCISIEDLNTGVITPLAEGARYDLWVEAGTDVGEPRLMLHATASMPFVLEDVTCMGGADGRAVLTLPEGVAAVSWGDAFGNVAHEEPWPAAGELVIEGLEAGNHMVSVSEGSVCGTVTHTFVVAEPFALEAAPVVVPTGCEGDHDGTIALDVLGGTAPYAYEWSNGGSEGTAEGLAKGEYDVKVTDANGCTLVLEGLVVEATTVIAGDLVAPESALPAMPVAFTSTAEGSIAHAWDFGDGTTGFGTEAEHVYALPGEYMVTLSLHDGMCDKSLTHTLSVEVAAGVGAHEQDALRAWSTGHSLVLLNGSGEAGDLRVFDASGRVVATHRVAAGTERSEWSTAGWPVGIYHLEVVSAHGRWTTTLPVGH